jgi:hypothetical protein
MINNELSCRFQVKGKFHPSIGFRMLCSRSWDPPILFPQVLAIHHIPNPKTHIKKNHRKNGIWGNHEHPKVPVLRKVCWDLWVEIGMALEHCWGRSLLGQHDTYVMLFSGFGCCSQAALPLFHTFL